VCALHAVTSDVVILGGLCAITLYTFLFSCNGGPTTVGSGSTRISTMPVFLNTQAITTTAGACVVM